MKKICHNKSSKIRLELDIYYLELGDRIPKGWNSTQKNQANKMYPGTSQANFLRFSSLSQMDISHHYKSI